MKIIQIVRNFSNGGAERFVIDLSNQLHRSGHQVTIIRFHDEQALNFFEGEVLPGVRVLTFHRKGKLDLSLMRRLKRFLAAERPDVVHTHMNDAFLYNTLATLSLRKTAFVHTLHNLPVEEAVGKVGLHLRKYLFRRGKVVPVTIAREACQLTEKVYGMPSVPLIFNGRELAPRTEQFGEVARYLQSLRDTPDTKIILNVGRFSEQKNQLLLVNTVKQLNAAGKKCKLLIIGSDQSAAVIEALKGAADKNVIFLGKRSNVQDYLYAADVFSLSSLWEGMPISLIEAFSAGCIPVCTPAGGIASMIQDGASGFLAKGFAGEDLLKAFCDYFKCGPEQLTAIATEARNAFHQLYDIEICTGNYVQLYRQTLDGRQAA